MFDLVRRVLELDHRGESQPFGNVTRLVDFLKEYGTYPPFYAVEEGANEPECVIEGKKYLMFTSNNYLSLSEEPAVREAAIQAIERYGIGPGGSRVLSGTLDVTVELEAKIARLLGTEDCLTFPTGYMANVSVFSALMNPFLGRMPYDRRDGVVFLDEFIHGSIEDGCRLAGARVVRFRHDDLTDLRHKIEENLERTNRLIVTEGVYCLEGEIIDIPAYVALAREYEAKLMVDDAHAIGVIGSRGGGSPDYHAIPGQIDLLMGAMDKGLGGTGGYLAGSRALIDYLRIATNSSMLSSALPASMAGAMLVALSIAEQADDRRQDLARKCRYLRSGLREAGLQVLGEDDIPSVPLFLGREEIGIEFAARLREKGIFAIIMRWPGVPAQRSRIRLSLMARHTYDHLDRLIDACRETGRELGVIPAAV
ncbi:MAG: pyridoxal phosphate-dependent aminotransferase family protein [Thermoleophilia bacterium]